MQRKYKIQIIAAGAASAILFGLIMICFAFLLPGKIIIGSEFAFLSFIITDITLITLIIRKSSCDLPVKEL